MAWGLCLSGWGRGHVIQAYSTGLNYHVLQGVKSQGLLSFLEGRGIPGTEQLRC